MPTMPEKIELAKQFLGKNWVLANGSTYDAKRREPSGVCRTLRPVMLKALKEGRL